MRKYSKEDFTRFMGINIGCLMTAFGIVVFRNPNNFASGGTAGLALLAGHFLSAVPVGAIMLVLNVLVLIFGFFILGKGKTAKSLYGTVAISAMIWAFEVLIPLDAPLTNQPFLELIYSVLIPGFGIALIFHFGATGGGTDIVAQIISKFTKMKVTTSLLITDFLIALGAGLLFGTAAMLYSVLGVFLRIFAMDSVMESLKIHKIVVVISDKSAEIQSFIATEINRGATVHKATGVYTKEEKEVITTILNRRQALELQSFIKKIDPHAFLTVSNSTEIIGMGFGKFD